MTRRSLSDLEDDLAALEAATDDIGGEELLFARRDPRTGELTTSGGEAVDPDDHGADQLIIVESVIVMDRERAEANGLDILGPADVPNDRDVVRVPRDAHRELDEEDRHWHAE